MPRRVAKVLRKKSVNGINATILSITIVAAVVILSVNNADKNSTTVVTLLGIVSLLAMQAITANKAADAADTTRDIKHEVTNGLVPHKLNEALQDDETKNLIREAVKDAERQ